MAGQQKKASSELFQRLRSAYEAQGCAWESLPEEFRRLLSGLVREHETDRAHHGEPPGGAAQRQASNDNNRSFFEAAPAALLLVDRFGLIHDANAAATRLLGSEMSHVCGQLVTGFIVAEDLPGFQSYWEQLADASPANCCEVRLKHRGGVLIHVLVAAQGIDGSGAPGRLLLTLTDITRLRQTERDLRLAQTELADRNKQLTVELDLTNRRLRSEVRQHREVARALQITELQYEMLVENTTEGIVVTQDFQVRFANRALCEMLGQSPEQLRGAPILQFAHPDDRLAVTERHRARMEGQIRPESYCLRLFDRNNQLRWFQVSLVSIEWEEHPAALLFLKDITQRMAVEERLERERELLHMVLDNIPVMITCHDSQGKIFLWNKALEKTLGWTEADFCKRPVMELCFPDPKYRREVWKLMTRNLGEWRDIELVGKDGSVVTGVWTSVRLADGRQIGIGIDIRERLELERRVEDEHRMLTTILDNIPVLVTVYDREARVLYMNPHYLRILGWTKEDFETADALELLLPDPKERREGLEFMMTYPDRWHDFNTRTKTGAVAPTSWKNVFLADGKMIGIGIDIRDRVKAENELREAFAQLERKHTALNEVIAQVEAKQQEVKTIVALNIEKALSPVLRRLKRQTRDKRLLLNVELAERALENIASPLMNKIEARFSDLTKREQEVALLLGKGYSTEDAAAALGMSLATAQKYRELIRKKLRLTGRKINLNAYLRRFVEGD